MLKKLAKLRGRNFTEIKERTRQRVRIFAERIGGGDLTTLDNDGIFSKIDLPGRDLTTESLLEHFRSRTTPHFYRSMTDSKESAAMLRNRFPAEEGALIAQAEK